MSATHPIYGAGSAPKAAPVQPANSPLADFLLANASGDAAQDFKTIAATLFGGANSTPANAQAAAKGPVAKDEFGIRKSKETSNSSLALVTHPESPVPLVNLPQLNTLQPAPRIVREAEATAPEANIDTLPLQAMELRLGDFAAPESKAGTGSSDTSAKPAGYSALAMNPAVPGAVKQDDVRARDNLGGVSKEMTPSSGESSTPVVQTLAEQPPAGDSVKQSTHGVKGIDSFFVSGASGKKSAEPAKPVDDRPRETVANPVVKHDSMQASIMIKPALPADASAAESPSGVPPLATGAVPVAPTPDQGSVTTGTQASPVATMAAAQADSAASAKTESKGGSTRTSPSESGRIKDRNNKDRDSKETRIATGLSGKSVLSQAGQTAAGSNNSSGGNNKDLASTVMPNHSGAHTKAEPLKPAAGSPSSSVGLSESDGPDEAVPTTASSPLTAKMVQGMSQSEFRVGMQSPEFGNIDIRTSVARHMFSAQISVEHSDMAKSMATELPALYSKLADQHVPVANIVIQGQSLATSAGLSQDAQPQTWRPQSNYSSTRTSAEVIMPAMTEVFNSAGRLDIRI